MKKFNNLNKIILLDCCRGSWEVDVKTYLFVVVLVRENYSLVRKTQGIYVYNSGIR